MENYESMGTVGEGTYGVVIKARHKETGQIVAIKKFKESDEDEQVRKTALREVRILKQLKHDHIVNLVEVFRRKGKLYLVFEYVDKTILEELEQHPYGLSELEVKKCTYQLLKGVQYCHDNNIIHRDIKPENILVSKHGALKLCDFGFARALAGNGAKYTDYVATRWYRSPELLVGDTEYSKPVDVWAIGCNVAELSNGIPLFPGESDIDQLFHIIKCFGGLTARQVDIFKKNPLYVGIELPKSYDLDSIEQRFSTPQQRYMLDFLLKCLHYDPENRDSCAELLASSFFKNQGFDTWFEEELRQIMEKDANPLVVKRKKARRPRSQQGPRAESGIPVSDVDSHSTQQITVEDRSRSSSIFEGTQGELQEEFPHPPQHPSQQKVVATPPAAPGVLPHDSLSDLYLMAQKNEQDGKEKHPLPQGVPLPFNQQSEPGSPSTPAKSGSPIPNPLKTGHFHMGPFSTVINTNEEGSSDLVKYNVFPEDTGVGGPDHLPNLSRLNPQLNIPVVAFPHIPNDQTTYLSQGTVKKENMGTTFPTLSPLDANAGLLKYNTKSSKKGKKHDKSEKYDSKPVNKYPSSNNFMPGPIPKFGSGSGPSTSGIVPMSTPPSFSQPSFAPHPVLQHDTNSSHVTDFPPPSREGRNHKF